MDREAYELYLKGRHHHFKVTGEEARKALDYFDQAVQRNPDFTDAHAFIAIATMQLVLLGELSPLAGYPVAREATRKASSLDDSSMEAHVAMGEVRMYADWNWAEAEKEYQKGLALDPGASRPYWNYAYHYLTPMGRFEEAIAEGKKAIELDPANVMAGFFLAYEYYFARRYDLAEAELTKVLELEPNYAPAHGILAVVYVQQEKYAEAILEAERYVSLGGRVATSLPLLVVAYARGGREAEGRKVLQELEALSQKSYVAPVVMSRAYASLNDADRAVAWLESVRNARPTARAAEGRPAF